MSKQLYNDREIIEYLLGSLSEAESERFDELSVTDDNFADALKAAEKDLVDAYVQGELTGAELEKLKSYYLASPLRRKNVEFAQAFQGWAEQNAIAPATGVNAESFAEKPKRRSWFSALGVFTTQRPALQWGFAVAALLLFAVAGLLVFRSLPVRQQITQPQVRSTTPIATPTASPTLAPEGASAPVIAQLIDGGGRVTLDREGKLSGVDNLLPAYQRIVKEALTNQRLEKSSLLAGLKRPASSLMGGDEQGNKFSVTAPVGKVMLADHPTFRWSPLNGATGYVIEVYDEKFNLVATSSQLTSNSWTAPQPLKRGQIYAWQVKAIKDGQEFKSPRPPAPQANFRILDQAKTNELARARRAYGSSHLTLGVLYAQAGLLDEAEQELRALQKANPNSAVARRLLVSVQTMRH